MGSGAGNNLSPIIEQTARRSEIPAISYGLRRVAKETTAIAQIPADKTEKVDRTTIAATTGTG